MTRTEPPDVAILAARLQRAFPSLSAYSSASLAVELCRIERAQHRHAERCCSGKDGGYVKRTVFTDPHDLSTETRAVHDPAAEERAGQRIVAQCGGWLMRLAARLSQCIDDMPSIELQHDPRGRVLLVRLPGEAEPAGV